MLSCLFAALFLMLSLLESIVPTTDGTTVLFRIVNVCCVVCIFVSVVQSIPPLEPTWYILADAKADEDADAEAEAAADADAAEVVAEAV
jgi:hypothetical protein